MSISDGISNEKINIQKEKKLKICISSFVDLKKRSLIINMIKKMDGIYDPDLSFDCDVLVSGGIMSQKCRVIFIIKKSKFSKII